MFMERLLILGAAILSLTTNTVRASNNRRTPPPPPPRRKAVPPPAPPASAFGKGLGGRTVAAWKLWAAEQANAPAVGGPPAQTASEVEEKSPPESTSPSSTDENGCNICMSNDFPLLEHECCDGAVCTTCARRLNCCPYCRQSFDGTLQDQTVLYVAVGDLFERNEVIERQLTALGVHAQHLYGRNAAEIPDALTRRVDMQHGRDMKQYLHNGWADEIQSTRQQELRAELIRIAALHQVQRVSETQTRTESANANE